MQKFGVVSSDLEHLLTFKRNMLINAKVSVNSNYYAMPNVFMMDDDGAPALGHYFRPIISVEFKSPACSFLCPAWQAASASGKYLFINCGHEGCMEGPNLQYNLPACVRDDFDSLMSKGEARLMASLKKVLGIDFQSRASTHHGLVMTQYELDLFEDIDEHLNADPPPVVSVITSTAGTRVTINPIAVLNSMTRCATLRDGAEGAAGKELVRDATARLKELFETEMQLVTEAERSASVMDAMRDTGILAVWSVMVKPFLECMTLWQSRQQVRAESRIAFYTKIVYNQEFKAMRETLIRAELSGKNQRMTEPLWQCILAYAGGLLYPSVTTDGTGAHPYPSLANTQGSAMRALYYKRLSVAASNGQFKVGDGSTSWKDAVIKLGAAFMNRAFDQLHLVCGIDLPHQSPKMHLLHFGWVWQGEDDEWEQWEDGGVENLGAGAGWEQLPDAAAGGPEEEEEEDGEA